ncbi:hypothetical protein P0W64_18810 [Tsukamurella sp. 8F]|uniref:hypothetical protein n=1 Tax=unclassified Tsukamurella TaxID=2633480 RepID=UPI0023B91020|nr:MULTISPECIES: hypothetical protein [unclassified Tsukamurella]MDF0531553.1 hypothetical protein [Tsukamurella sp. 8J]MDF0588835.1 hypothetical protein [Tsukamurella sp. 8F]
MRTHPAVRRTAAAALGLTAAATMAAGAASAAPAKPKPAPKPVTATGTCTSNNPVGLITHDQVKWTVKAVVTKPGVVTVSGSATIGQQDVIVRQFGATAEVSWNNTSSGKYGTVAMSGNGERPTLSPTPIVTGKGPVTLNAVIKVGAGATWIAPQVSTPCVVSIQV